LLIGPPDRGSIPSEGGLRREETWVVMNRTSIKEQPKIQC
jgi:hypothetical protein